MTNHDIEVTNRISDVSPRQFRRCADAFYRNAKNWWHGGDLETVVRLKRTWEDANMGVSEARDLSKVSNAAFRYAHIAEVELRQPGSNLPVATMTFDRQKSTNQIVYNVPGPAVRYIMQTGPLKEAEFVQNPA